MPMTATATVTQADRLIDVKELALLLGICQRSVVRHALAGRLPPPVRLGRSQRWRHAEIQRWLANGCPDPRNV